MKTRNRDSRTSGPDDRVQIKVQIRRQLDRLQRRTLAAGYDREAAVLMPVFERDGEPCFLLTLRTEGVRTHKGQISFPGGMRQNGESLEETALRETREEIGIGNERIEILGRFHDYLSINGYLVAPYAGYIREPSRTVPQADEVAEIIQVPFSIFGDPGRLRIERMTRLGETVDVYFYRFGHYEIWGLTARIIKDFLESLRFIRKS